MRLAVIVLLVLSACGRDKRAKLPEGTPATIVLEAEVVGVPEQVRSVWSARFKSAVDTGFLPVVSASAEVQGQKLVLTTELVVAGGCTQAGADALAERVRETATRTGELGIHRVRAIDAENLATDLRKALGGSAAGVRVSTPYDLPGAVVIGGKPFEDVAEAAKAFLPPGVLLLPETAQAQGDLRAWVVEEAAVLDGAAVTRAWSEDNEMGAPTVRVSLSEAAARTFGDLTSEQLRKPVPIVFEGKVVAAPLVVGRIETGNLQIALPPDMRADAPTIAAVMTSGGLRETPKVVKLEARCSP